MNWVKLNLKETRPTLIANVYRPPSDKIDAAIELLGSHLTEVTSSGNPDILIVGDLNIDLLKNSNDTKRFNTFIDSHLMNQLINEPTRVTTTTRSLIDHVITNNTDFYSIPGCFDPDLSDHCLLFTTRKCLKPKYTTSYFWGRSFRNFNENLFYLDSRSVNWLPLYCMTDIDTATGYFTNVSLRIIDVHASIKRMKCRREQPKWVTNDFLSLIDEKEHLCNIHKWCPTPFNEAHERVVQW